MNIQKALEKEAEELYLKIDQSAESRKQNQTELEVKNQQLKKECQTKSNLIKELELKVKTQENEIEKFAGKTQKWKIKLDTEITNAKATAIQ